MSWVVRTLCTKTGDLPAMRVVLMKMAITIRSQRLFDNPQDCLRGVCCGESVVAFGCFRRPALTFRRYEGWLEKLGNM